jgi:hypothetical protein
MKRRVVLGLVVAAALAAPVSALAHRPATAAEKKAIRTAVAAYVKKPSSHAAPDNTVVAALISTVDSKYAALLKGDGTHWKVIGFGPAQKCSLASNAVRNDLSILCGQQ